MDVDAAPAEAPAAAAAAAPSAVSDAVLAEHVRALLLVSDLDATTERKLRTALEAQLGVPLMERKVFIRAQARRCVARALPRCGGAHAGDAARERSPGLCGGRRRAERGSAPALLAPQVEAFLLERAPPAAEEPEQEEDGCARLAHDTHTLEAATPGESPAAAGAPIARTHAADTRLAQETDAASVAPRAQRGHKKAQEEERRLPCAGAVAAHGGVHGRARGAPQRGGLRAVEAHQGAQPERSCACGGSADARSRCASACATRVRCRCRCSPSTLAR
jgi:hypothetical protein